MTGRLHVVQLLPALYSGGTEATTLETGRALVEHGHRSTVISGGGPMVETLMAQGSRHVQMNVGDKRPWTLLSAVALAAWLRRNRPDIVHVRSRLPAWVLELALRMIPRAHQPHRISTVHGMNSVSRYSAIMLRAERVIAVSPATAAYWQAGYPSIRQDHVQVIEPGVDRQRFCHGWKPDEDWQARFLADFPQIANSKVICLPGRLSRLKGHQAFIDLIDRLKQSDHAVCGIIVGGEEPGRQAYAQSLYQQVNERGLAEHIVFAGQRNDLRECLAMSDVVFSLSNKPETFGRTVLEALSLGRPVIGWDHGGVSDLLRTLCPLGAVKPFDDNSLFQRSLDFLDTPPEIPPDHPFTLDNACRKALALYEELAV